MAPFYRLGEAPGYRGIPFAIGPYHFTLPAFPMHAQDFGELVFVTAGRGIHHTSRERYPIETGDVFYVPPMELHGFSDASGVRLINLAYDESFARIDEEVKQLPGYRSLFLVQPALRSGEGGDNRLKLGREELAYVRALLDRLESEHRGGVPGSVSMVRTLLSQLVIYLAREFTRLRPVEEDRRWQIARVAAILETAFREEHRLSHLARMAGMSTNTLLRHFRHRYGMSPMQYLLEVRMRQARKELETTALTVGEIAHRCGFNDSNYFARQFGSKNGCSPREYRSARSP